MMTPEALKALIDSDEHATQLASVGDDANCAVRCMEIADLVNMNIEQLTDRGLYKSLGPLVAETILQKLEGYAVAGQTHSTIIKRFLKWLEPNNGGVDFGDPGVLTLIDGLTVGGLFTTEENTALKSLSLRQPIINADDVTQAMYDSRLGMQ
jgi:hypothetical protein